MESNDYVTRYGMDRFAEAEKILTSTNNIECFHKERGYRETDDKVERYYHFVVKDQLYCIEVWPDSYYLLIGGLRIMFHHLGVSNVWPDDHAYLHFFSNHFIDSPFGRIWDTVAYIDLDGKREV